MAATEVKIGHDTLLKRGDGGSPETFSTFAEITNIGGPNWSVNLVDATHMESPDGYMEWIYGLKDGQEIPIDIQFVPSSTGWTNILSDFDNKVTRNFQLVCNDTAGSTFTFSALVSNISAVIPVGEKQTCTITLKVSGAITQTV